MGRAPCCDKAHVKKGPWSPEEDEKLKKYIDKNGTGGNWISLPQKAGLKRCGKSCRLRWLNYLRPNIKHGEFTDHEDRIICTLFSNIGSRWSIIAAQLPGRTDNDIKNYWNTKLKKKLVSMNFQANNYSNTPNQIQQQSHSHSISFFLQTSSSSSSSSSPSISYRQQHQPNWSVRTNIFEPVTTPFSSVNYFINPASHVANLHPMQQYYQVSDIGTSASTSTSSEMGVQNYNNLYDGWSTTTTTSTQEDHHHHHHYDQKQNEIQISWESEGLLDFGIEEIKQLISAGSTSTSSNYSSLFDENYKTEDQRVNVYY